MASYVTVPFEVSLAPCRSGLCLHCGAVDPTGQSGGIQWAGSSPDTGGHAQRSTISILNVGKWKNSSDIMTMVTMHVVTRPGVKLMRPHDNIHNWTGHAIGTPNVSSTEVRESTDMDFLRANLHEYVLQYIADHELFAIGEAIGKAKSNLRFSAGKLVTRTH